MDCVKGALKSSFLPEKTAHQHNSGEEFLFSGTGTVAGEDFSVDDLLDFSNGFIEEEDEGEKLKAPLNDAVTVSVPVLPDEGKMVISQPVKEEAFGSLPCSELTVPADDLESLEWLSHFVEDSFTGYSLTCPVAKPAENREAPVQEKTCFVTPVQTKARTKRGRTGVRVWPAGSGSLTESSSTSSSSSSTLSSSPPRTTTTTQPWLVFSGRVQTPGSKRVKKKAAVNGPGPGQGPVPRRCSHCGVQKTPQWRAGPMGAKTLCNACGVRFKSGRLLPEYRPACSPTFSTELHSNNHRKVLEMRRKKELEGPGLSHPVQSF